MSKQKPTLQVLHNRAVKAYGVAVGATPRTKTADRLWAAYEKAEKEFTNALPIDQRDDPADR